MKIYQLSKENGKNITQFKSNFIMSRIINTEASASIGCMYLEENGVIGYHQAVVPQLLLIIEGEGFVKNEQEQYFQVQPGDAIFWEKDEWHETKSDKGLTGIVIESEHLNPAAFMPLKLVVDIF
ncbi:cupin [Lysinibacillus sp. KCTC 33748]|uniref:cupin domain-containing protein n=1 Tax=unclassified Lysinibacillus TaxID=2636778 RepID=UPI0009A75413|nr:MULTISPECIES: AraC family ligand binding domain-containing protein [unclassified Lysinibacillus]OXS74459.1 cupin [Lysinibacillus sp. KCTC 33748]SKB66974.1 Cupin domain protein [Lysinibacillus sp. AC-3]